MATIDSRTNFPAVTFRGKLRPSQADVVRIAEPKLAAGGRKLHIVAPPGSGKTVVGLYLWAMLVRQPVVILSPNSAIQMQWAARTDLFDFPAGRERLISTDPAAPALLTSLTYQSITLPQRNRADIDEAARTLWREQLLVKGEAESEEEAEIWITDLAEHNPGYFERRFATYRKQVRDEAARGGQSLDMLHRSARETLERLKAQRVGMVILDECHHLLGHWGRVLADAHDLLDGPVVVGLTATPPDRGGHSPADVARYDKYFGPVDYEVPVPAVVKDGFLAPYQDLAYFVRPTEPELAFIANTDDSFAKLIEELCQPQTEAMAAPEPESEPAPKVDMNAEAEIASEEDPSEAPTRRFSDRSLPDWLIDVLRERRLPTGTARDWDTFEKRDPVFATAARHFLVRCHVPALREVPPPDSLPPAEESELPLWVPVLDRYVRHRLRRSCDQADHRRAERVIRQLRLLGVQITDTGTQGCASPVSRVLAYSTAKTEGLVRILATEMRHLGQKMRAVVVADYEKSSAVAAEIRDLLNPEAGGAVAAFRAVLRDPQTNRLDPVLVTGSSLLVDADLAHAFDAAAEAWLAERNIDVKLKYGQEEGFHVINGDGADWSPRTYVAMVTELFQRGVTRCLVGTRGLLGEGWDATKVNVLVDLTTVTTSMTVNQLRGRSIRLDPDDPEKVANNWDIVCIAPEFTKGLDDYRRFLARHEHLYGLADDGAVEKGAGHVHPAFNELRPEAIEGSMGLLNDDMLSRAGQRKQARALWQIGKPYRAEPVRAVEARVALGREGGFPPFYGANAPWSGESLTGAIGTAILAALAETKQIRGSTRLHLGERAGGYVRAFLEEATEEESRLFAASLAEALGPLVQPRYVIPREIDVLEATWLSSVLPEIVGRYFQRRVRKTSMLHAVPTALARTKETAALYERFWNQYVSPGQALFAHRGAGQTLLDRAKRNGWTSTTVPREKDIFFTS